MIVRAMLNTLLVLLLMTVVWTKQWMLRWRDTQRKLLQRDVRSQ